MLIRLAAAAVLAAAAFGFTFRGPRDRFWDRMTATGVTLGTVAIAAEPRNRRPRLSASDAALGVGSAAALWAIFHAGDRLARAIMPRGNAEIDELYALQGERPALELAVRLAAVIGPAEELFWRGYMQRALMGRFGRWTGAGLGAAAYASVHLASGNLTLTAAAATAGAFWAALYAAGASVAALIVSHVAWDIWIFLVAPTSPRRARGDTPDETA